MKKKKGYLIIFLIIYLAEVLIISIMIRDKEELNSPHIIVLSGDHISKILSIEHIENATVVSRMTGIYTTDESEKENVDLLIIGSDYKGYTITSGQDISSYSAVVNERLNEVLIKKLKYSGKEFSIGGLISLDVQGYEMIVTISGVCRDETEEPRMYLSSERMQNGSFSCTEEIHVTVHRRSYLPDIAKALDDIGISTAFNDEIEMIQGKKRTILIGVVALLFIELFFILTALRDRDNEFAAALLSNVFALLVMIIILSFSLIPIVRAYLEYKGFPVDLMAVLTVSLIFIIHELFMLMSVNRAKN